MKTKIKRHSRSVLSVVLALCMLVSCMTAGMIMTDAAKVDSESVGYDTYYVKGSWDSWTLHNITSDTYPVDLEANKTYSFVFMANSDQFASNTTIKNSTDYNFSKNSNASITLQTAAAGSYVFSFKGMDGGQTSMSVHIEFPVDTTPTTWTAVGDNTAIFGTAWSPTANANDLEKDSTGSMWRKTWNGVQLTNGSTVKYKVAKNHAWTTTYPSSDATATVPGTSGTGLYNVTVTYNESTNAVNMTFANAVTYTLAVPTVENAVVKASYNGNTVNEGGTLSGIPAGEEVTISVTPDAGYSCTGVSSTPSANVTGSGRTWKLTMPSANVTNLTVTLGTESTKRVYFYNVNTEYAMVSAYVDYNGTKPFGAYPGKTMTRLDNSNVWYVDVPEGATDITFIGDNGYNTGSLTIPSTTNPMYTAGSDKEHPATGGTWGTYTVRNNEYTVSKGSTLNDSSLFTGITATMYDYYVDGEITGNNGWLEDIGGREYSQNNGHNFNWNPFTTLNQALSDYALAKGVTYPLYFGNLNTQNINTCPEGTNNGMKATIEGYTNWNFAINNSIGLDADHNAVTGLTGQTIQNDNTRHYKNGATNENGAPMAFFDEDFLSGINSQNTTLATILRSAAFPVRKTTEGATITYPNKIYVLADGTDGTVNWEDDNAQIWVRFVNSSGNGLGDFKMTKEGNYWTATVPSGTSKISLVRMPKNYSGTTIDYNQKWNKSNDVAATTDTTSANRLYKITSWDGTPGRANIGDSYQIHTGGHVYYEFDSTGGKDNAYVEDIDKDNNTAVLNYYAASDNKKVLAATTSGGQNGDPGFYPFDNNNFQRHINDLARDLGFGMKLEIPFTIDANGINSTDNTHQVFRFSGDDDLWVYIDGHLVLDLGGAHLQTEGEIDFATTTVKAEKKQSVGSGSRNGNFGSWFDNTNPNAVHTMTIYYMERGMFDSNLKFGFSFHAIPNQLKVEKKVRTANVNSGFYIVNNTTQSDYTVDNGRAVTWFEKSYQYEGFNVIQTSGAAPKTPTSVQYTLDQAPGTTQAGSTQMTSTTSPSNNYQLGYTLRNDFTAYFMNQYDANTPITLKEAFNSGNMYRYTPSVTVYDDANNKKEFTTTTGTPAAGQVKGNATDGATFLFAETHNTGIENLNLRARFTNQMNTHDLYIYKKTNVTDTTTPFTLNIKFKTDSTEYTPHGFTAYPLYCSLDGEDTQLSATGDITIKAGQELIIPKIPENAQIQIIETLPNDSAYTYSGTDLAYTSGVSVEPDATVTSGIQFTMGSDDMKATVNNAQADPVMIFHDLKLGSVGDADTYVTAVVTNAAGTETKVTYDKTPGRITIDPQYLKKDSTDKIVITLETTPIGAYAFEKFWEDIRSTMEELKQNGVNYKADIDSARMTATVTINVKDLFDTSTGAQLYTELPFYSSLLDLQRNLTITKKLTTGTDADTAFTVHVTKNGEPYTGAYKKDGSTYQTSDGIFTMHQNDTILIEGLRVGENVSVFETDIPFNYEFSKATLGTDDDTNVASEGTTGYAFTVSEDTALTIWNAPIEYTYVLTYSYSSYRNLHQTQKYKYSGTFNANTDLLQKYLKVSDQVPDADNHGNTCTAYWFKDDDARKNFINILGPYENNYMKLLYWNTDMKSNSNPNGVSIVYTSKNHKYTIDVNATVSEDNYVDLYFKFPYAHDVRDNGYAAIETDGKVVENMTQETEDIPNLDYKTWYAVNGYKSYEEAAAHDTMPQFVAAPKVIYDGDTPKYFRYWTVKTVPSDNDYQSVEYTKCYYYEFNLAIYQDSIVEPVYTALTSEEIAAGYTPSPHAEAIKDGNANGAVVTFIENSRNRYNVYNTNISAETRRNQGDRIYNDFLLSYASESDLQYRTFDEGTYTAGIAIQRVARLDTNGDDVITDTAHYAEKYGSSTDTMTFVAPGTETKTAFSKSELQNFVKGSATYNDNFGLERSQFDATRLDNKNRIQYYYSYSIKSHSDLTVDTGNKDYVYRAFAYMIDNTTGEIELLSDAPLYYTFYDMASIANAQEGYDIDFPTTP